MDKDEKKLIVDLFSKGVSEQNIEARHCETLSISLLIFAITSVLAVSTALLNAKGFHWITFEIIQIFIAVYGVNFMLLGFILMTSRKQATEQAKKGLTVITNINPNLSEYFQELLGINVLAEEGRFGSRSSLPKIVFFFGFASMLVTLIFSLAELIRLIM
jgi:hypothetical protein